MTGQACGAPEHRLVGRDGLLAEIHALLARPATVVLSGPSGIGKSAVADAVAGAAAERGALVLRAVGSESERWLSYSVLADLLTQIPESLLAELSTPQRDAVDSILGSGPLAAPSADVRFHGQRAWSRLLQACARTRRTLLVLDDAQWLDVASNEAVLYAGRKPPPDTMSTLIAGRWAELPGQEPVGRQSGWFAMHGATEVPVPPLGPGEVATLLHRFGVPARIAHKLHADSGGRPYLALALGGAFSGRTARAYGPTVLPPRIHTALSERFGMLPAAARETLLVAALVDRPTVPVLLRAGRVDAERDVRLAAEAGVICVEGHNIRFTPPALRTLIAESVGAEQRSAVHATLSTVVTAAAGRIRHLAMASSDPDAELARSLVQAAKSACEQGSRALAAELYVLAAERTPADLTEERLEWLTAAAEVGVTACQPEIVHRAAEAVLATDASAEHRVRVRLALIDLSNQAMTTEGEQFAAALVDAGSEPELRGPVLMRMASAALVNGQPALAIREAERAVRCARACGDTTTEVKALTQQAAAMRVTGRADYSEVLDVALALPQPLMDGWLHMAPRFLAARFAVFEDRLDEARDSLLRMLALLERGAGEELCDVLRCLSEVSARQGRCREALDFADRFARVSEAAGLSPGPCWYSAALVELAGGSLERAESFAECGAQASEQEGDGIFLGRNLHALAQARMRQGDIGSGVRTLRRIQELEQEQGVFEPMVLRWHGDLAVGLAELGDLDESEEVIHTVREAVRDKISAAGVVAQLDRAEALLRSRRGDTGSALHLLTRATERFLELGQPLEQGHCLLMRATIERRRRRYAAARLAAEDALAVFARCDARSWVEQTQQALASAVGSAGIPSARHGESEPGGALTELTSTEERIALMVGEGASNREVAARMYLSVKTVEASLTRIYRKVGVRSRTQLSSRLGAASVR